MPPRKRGGAADRMAAVSGASPSPAPTPPPFAADLVDGEHPLRGTEHDAAPAPAVLSPREQARPVRMTVVLQPVEYDRLQDFTHDAQRATGRRGVAASELVRFALDRVLGDEALRRELVERVGREGGNRRREGGKRTRS